ncbi:odorant receptor 9a-like [Aphidius gifuensis]|uniref:odorant receptor 9a-like n=1 Tax=Aphidius gifuensis TaxID=684658 RepID=UPI001CDD8B76|nr:odorant receptor 9a-like [Aphidius gifuensis]
MKKLLVLIQNDWIEYKNGPESLILKKYAKFSNKLTLMYFGIIWSTMTPFLTIPLVPLIFNIFVSQNNSIQRQHLYAQYEYVFDSDKNYYPVLIHSYIGSFAFINAVVAIDAMITMYIEHACALFSIIGYVKLLDNANSISYFFQLGIDIICLSFTGFQIATKIDNSPDAAMRFAAYSTSLLVVLYFLSYPGQQLIDHSLKICHNIYKANWYCTSLRTRKLLIFMAMRSSIPCQITAGKLYVMDITSFKLVVKTSISYVMVLLSVQE